MVVGLIDYGEKELPYFLNILSHTKNGFYFSIIFLFALGGGLFTHRKALASVSYSLRYFIAGYSRMWE
jgi:hypothetical protein